MGSLTVAVNLPFKPELVDADLDLYADLESDALFKMLPGNAKEYVQNSPHLLEYLHTFPVNTYGIPLFLSELKKDVRSMKNPNIIYPVNDTTFVHILPDPDDVRNFYIPIEPSFLHSVSEILPVIETKLIDLIDGLDTDPTTDKERTDVLKKMLASVAMIKPLGVDIASLTRTETKGRGIIQTDDLPQHGFYRAEQDEVRQEEQESPHHPGWQDYSLQRRDTRLSNISLSGIKSIWGSSSHSFPTHISKISHVMV